jgi:hypothetical protein
MIVSGARERKGIQVLEDGTRVYKNYVRYKPVPLEKRKYKVRKPPVEGAVMYQREWWLPLVLLPDAQRVVPATRPDTDAYEHMTKAKKCKCTVCKRPESELWKDKWRRGVSLRPLTPNPQQEYPSG